MTECGRRFDEALLSGLLDGALTQQDEQRVRVHLEDCPICTEQVDGLRRLREITMTSQVDTPSDDQWDELPRSAASHTSLHMGTVLIAVWAAGTGALGLYALASSDDALVGKAVAVSGLAGIALLFGSVLLDRLRTRATDRYRRVKR